MSRVRLWQGDPTRRLTVVLPASLALDLKIEALRRGVDISVLAAQAFALVLDPRAEAPAPPPPLQAPALPGIGHQAEILRRGQELAALLRAALASGRVTLAEFARHLARTIGHPNPVGLASAIRQWKRVPELHQAPVAALLAQLGLDPGPRPDPPGQTVEPPAR